MRRIATALTHFHILAALQTFFLWGLPLQGSADVHAIDDISDWADWVEELTLGPVNTLQPELGFPSWGVEEDAIGAAQGDGTSVLSLGEGGVIVLGFDPPIADGSGDDLAVFENGFWTLAGLFGELAFVEVSSNGEDFARFESLSQQTNPIAAFGVLNPDLYENFAGLDEAGFGVGFDLFELKTHPLVTAGQLDLQAIGYVRLVDVVGDGSTPDAFGNLIYDPYPTQFESSGFDLDAVGAIHLPEPGGALLGWAGLLGLAWLTRKKNVHRTTRAAVLFCAVTLGSAAQAEYTVDFEDLSLPASGYENGSDESGSFESGTVQFENDYDSQWGSWRGFAVSNHTDNTIGGWSNQWSAMPGSGRAGSENYGVFYFDQYAPYPPKLILPNVETVSGMYVSNNAYAYFSMLDGDSFSKQFSAVDEDWFQLSVEGFDDDGISVGRLHFYLADFQSATAGPDYILDQWTWIDTADLGPVRSLGFNLSSSDNGEWGMNTPGYFALDDIEVVPEPNAMILLYVGLSVLLFIHRS